MRKGSSKPNTLEGIPTDIAILFHVDGLATSSALATTALMGFSELLKLGWNPFAVYGTCVGCLIVSWIAVHIAKRKG